MTSSEATTGQERPRSDDELDSLPALDGDEPSELDFGQDDLDGSDEPEQVGLDAAIGTEEEDDPDLDLDDAGDGDGDWADGEAEPLEADPELDSREEGGWIEGSEEATDTPGWDADLDTHAEDIPTQRDTGEEGVEERFEGEGDDDAALPPLAARDQEELADDLELQEEAEIETPGEDRGEHPVLALASAASNARVQWIGPGDDAITAVALLPMEQQAIAFGRELYRIDGTRLSTMMIDGLNGEIATSLAAVDSDHWVVGLRTGGVAHLELDAAGRIEPLKREGDPKAVRPFYVLADRHTDGVRLWGRSRGGPPVRSDDGGRTWSRPLVLGAALAFARGDDGEVVVVLGARQGAAQIMRTRDGGRSWRTNSGPSLEALPDGSEVFVACEGSHLLISSDASGIGPFWSSDDGQSWRSIESLRDAGPIAIVREADRLVAYAGLFVEALDRGFLVRTDLGSQTAEVVVDLERLRHTLHLGGSGDIEGDQRIHALTVAASRGKTSIYLGTGLGIVATEIEWGRTAAG